MMFIQEAPINTFWYMVLGYGVILVTMALYIASIVIRRRNLERDLELIEELEAD